MAERKHAFSDIGDAGVAVGAVEVDRVRAGLGQPAGAADFRADESAVAAFVDEERLTAAEVQGATDDELVAVGCGSVDIAAKEDHAGAVRVCGEAGTGRQRVAKIKHGSGIQNEGGTKFVVVLGIGWSVGCVGAEAQGTDTHAIG